MCCQRAASEYICVYILVNSLPRTERHARRARTNNDPAGTLSSALTLNSLARSHARTELPVIAGILCVYVYLHP